MTKYDWDKWTDGTVHCLVEGKDFTCTPKSFIRHAHLAAQHRNLVLNWTTYDFNIFNATFIGICFLTPEEHAKEYGADATCS